MRPYEALVDEADRADVTGWGFGFLDGRATEERPPWGYSRLLADRLARVGAAVDIDTGGGEVVDEAPVLPARMVVSESWPPNLERARERLRPRGVEVVPSEEGRPLPLAAESFDLVSSRHPVDPDWVEIHRLLRPGGEYVAQHVGPASAFELIECFTGPLPRHGLGREPAREAQDASDAGLSVTELRTARLRMEFFDVGAIVWILRKCVWWVPDFTVERYTDELRALDERMRGGEPIVAHSTRHLIIARR